MEKSGATRPSSPKNIENEPKTELTSHAIQMVGRITSATNGARDPVRGEGRGTEGRERSAASEVSLYRLEKSGECRRADVGTATEVGGRLIGRAGGAQMKDCSDLGCERWQRNVGRRQAAWTGSIEGGVRPMEEAPKDSSATVGGVG